MRDQRLSGWMPDSAPLSNRKNRHVPSSGGTRDPHMLVLQRPGRATEQACTSARCPHLTFCGIARLRRDGTAQSVVDGANCSIMKCPVPLCMIIQLYRDGLGCFVLEQLVLLHQKPPGLLPLGRVAWSCNKGAQAVSHRKAPTSVSAWYRQGVTIRITPS